MADDLVQRLRYHGMVISPSSDLCLKAAIHIQAQAAEIERLREALVTVRARIEDIENPFEDGTKQEHIAFEKAVDAAQLIAMEVLEKTLHVTETCKENGETFT